MSSNPRPIILGIESSCDDSCAAIVDSERNILSNIVISQNQSHAPYGGVVPEIAARSHLANISVATERALAAARLAISDIDAVAATTGPGLIGGVITGSVFAQTIANFTAKKFISINHLEGHALTARLTHNLPYPYLMLLASGGHCQFIAVLDLGKYKILGRTLDDAAGEAFDKLAKMLNLGFPGGPIVEEYAKGGNAEKFNFPLPMVNKKDTADMSFSGLKTAANLLIAKLKQERDELLDEQTKKDICASYQKAISAVLNIKSAAAASLYQKLLQDQNIKPDHMNFVIAGGVAANENLRATLSSRAQAMGYNFIASKGSLCTDNAAMIAWAGQERFEHKIFNKIGTPPKARWSIENID